MKEIEIKFLCRELDDLIFAIEFTQHKMWNSKKKKFLLGLEKTKQKLLTLEKIKFNKMERIKSVHKTDISSLPTNEKAIKK